MPITDTSITVCCKCKGEYWSWHTHGHYAGWTKLARHAYACPGCSATTSTPTPATAWASAAGNTASASAAGGSAWASAAGDSAAQGPKSENPAQAKREILARRIETLTVNLNERFHGNIPEWLKLCTDDNLKDAGRYDPAKGQGVRDEPDAGNFAGSILLLAMLAPDLYGSRGALGLTIWGAQPPAGLMVISSGPARLGRGADNRRTNVIEGILNYWQHSAENQDLRTELLEVWTLVRLAASCLYWKNDWPSPWLVGERCCEVVHCDDSVLPGFRVCDEQLLNFENVSACVTQAAARNLTALPRSGATKGAVAACVGMSPTAVVVSLIQKAIWRCEAANIAH